MKRLIGIALVFAASTAFAKGDKKPAETKKQPSPQEQQMAQMMAEMEKLATPGAEHKMLQDEVGMWTTQSKFWMEPGKPPQETSGTAETKTILGGRFVEEHVTSMMMGKPFEGIGLTGYDNSKKKFIVTWMDSMGTMMIYAEGTGDAKVRTFMGEETLPDGKKRPFKWVMKFDSPTKHSMEMWGPGMDGKDTKQMEVVYTKK
jgi:hypothetical protein